MRTVRFIHILIPVVLSVVLIGCTSNPPQEPSLILEGWIDANGYPVVMIHKSYVLGGEIPDSVMTLEEIAEQQIIMWGKVTISDGEQEVILTGRLDTLYIPPYTYSTLHISGEVGKTYKVTASYKDMYAEAITTIPPIATLDSILLTDNRNKTGKFLKAYVSATPSEDAYYAVFVRKRGDKQYKLSPMGVFETKAADEGNKEILIYNPLVSDSIKYNELFPSFPVDTAVSYQLKIARIDNISYRFWSEFSQMNSTKGIFFLPIYENIQGNVSGGIGNFTGMGSSIYELKITDKDSVFIFP